MNLPPSPPHSDHRAAADKVEAAREGVKPAVALPYQAIFDASPLPGSVARYSDGLMLAVNDAWVALTGLPREQVIGRKSSEFDFWADPDDRARYLSELPNTNSHHLLRFRGGQVHRVRLHSTVLDLDGEPCLLVFMGDVKKEHETELALEAANRALQHRVELLEASEKLARMGHWTNTDASATVEWSAGLYAIGGLQPKAVLSRVEGRSGIHPDDLPAWVAAREASDNRELEFRWLHPDGRTRWFRTRMSRTDVATSDVSNFGIIQDITAEREAKERLEAQLAFVQNITAHVPAVLFQGRSRPDGTSEVSFVNDAVRDLLELEPAQLLHDGSVFVARIYPPDRNKLLSALNASNQKMSTLHERVRFELPEKGLRWCNMMAVPRQEGDGSVLWHGFINDVTEAVRDSQSLEDTLKSINQGLSKVDASGRIVLYNRQCIDMLEIPEDLMVNQPRFSDMVRFQRERGDFGDKLEWVDGQGKRYLAQVSGPHTESQHEHFTARYLRKTRSGRSLEIRARKLPDGSVVRTYDDVTPFIEIQEALLAERLQLQATTSLLGEKTRALQDTLESISQGWTKSDASGRFVMYNRRMLELLDLPEALMLGQPTGEQVLRFQRERGDFGPDLAYVDESIRAPMDRGNLGQIPDRYLRRTRDGRTLELQAHPLSDGGMVRTCTDVTSYIAVQEALRAERQRLEWVLEATRPGIWETDLVTGDMTINARWADMLGYNLEELVPVRFTTWTDLLHPDDLPLAMDRHRAHCAQEIPYFECDLRMRHKTGQWVWVSTRGRVHRRDSDGKALFMSGTHVDITERVTAQEEVRALNASLEVRVNQRTVDLERTLKDMEAISYSIAHDLRAPLRAVNGFAAVIAESDTEGLDPSTRDMFERIVRSSRNMGQMLTDMLSLLQVVRVELELVPVDMGKIAQDVVRTFAEEVSPVTIHLQPLPPAMGDASLLRQVYSNLVDNAVKYSADQASANVWIGHDAARGAYFVRDNGIGFDMAHANKLFGLFQRLHAGSKIPGMGVGLAIVSRIIERHGGRIWADSQPAVGTTFWWTLPDGPG
ncbi:hypothetical protein LPB72_16935 [Hydrogenophaga crassostreae]|uniref:histidine kinase n=1 Tax=Hydrogenophaga crassostreae TaxID=1763535 RepID=A0A162YWA2_9BURK|nr:PAS-domain containing protein [Hydrogenophaga crassostreae]AOW12703.1 hypothetical protein LPB072_07455 [Hydrogenophaga crassostreae]OAD40575.1 hypothetical protein LPB72_16935 [Hydrogenophaga crassostreae]